ncbi:MAG: exonuclease domain-containing protein [Actinomycetia bacterium]|nr:exonuclease domain-containing protein [Actinomycetes bacterium]
MSLAGLIASGTTAEVAALYQEAAEQAAAGFELPDEPEVCLIDTETTGFSPDKDELIEVAMIRMRGAKVLDSWSTLLRPSRTLPREITELTGITEADLAGAPRLAEVAADIRDFIGDRDLVAHNADFDRRFIEMALGALPGGWCDSLTFLRCGMPRLTSYASSDLIAVCAPDRPELSEGAHRAGVDTQALAVLWRAGLAAVALLPLELLRACRELLQGTAEERWFSLLLGARGTGARGTGTVVPKRDHGACPPGPGARSLDLAALRKRQLAADKPPDEFYDAYEKELVFPETDEITADLSADGIAGRMYPAFEHRWEQQEMARRIARAQAASEHLVVEAGTGVGKSLAYLICAARLAQQNEITVGVATKTNALTDQLLYHELPRLSEALGGDLRFVGLKGYEHYPCLRKIDTQLRASRHELLTGVNLANLLVWCAQTPWGDLDNFNFPAFGAARASISASAGDCTKRRCRHFRQCYVHGLRRRARSAHIVVTNHSLLLRDTLSSSGILPPVRYWIVDEAHGAEAEARRQLSVAISERELNDLRVLLGSPDGSGALAGLQKLTTKLSADAAQVATTQLASFSALLEQLATRAKAFFTEIRTLREEGSSYATELWLSPQLRASQRWQACEQEGTGLARILAELKTAGQELTSAATRGLDSLSKEERGDALPDFVGLLMSLDEQAGALEQVLTPPRPELIYTIHISQSKRRGARPNASVSVEELSVAGHLAEDLYTRCNSVIFSSATLAAGESFARFAAGVGLDRLEPEAWSTLQLASSFDLPQQMRLIVARDLPQPGEAGYLSALADLLLQVHLSLQGGVLTLFTNNQDLTTLYQQLKAPLAVAGVPLLSQSAGFSRQAISDAFLRDPHSSLFATKSFWEGFDAPGDTLRCVVIPKLPFARPNDPLSQARRAAEGSSAWGRYDLPDAIIELKQATGRLIRSASDEGFVILGDARLLTKGYGRTIVDALPVKAEPLTREEIIRLLST